MGICVTELITQKFSIVDRININMEIGWSSDNIFLTWKTAYRFSKLSKLLLFAIFVVVVVVLSQQILPNQRSQFKLFNNCVPYFESCPVIFGSKKDIYIYEIRTLN